MIDFPGLNEGDLIGSFVRDALCFASAIVGVFEHSPGAKDLDGISQLASRNYPTLIA
jgi:hypothetical protein